MCGICGIYGLGDKKLIKRMADAIRHRGPDGDGYYVGDGISLGHRRLSIIDLKTGGQPIYNEDGSVVVVYNGEIYNYLEVKQDLVKKGHRFSTKTDTEILVHAYEEYGERFIERLNGIFAFAVYDSDKKVLLLARDRMGTKPLFYMESEGKLLFASEIKAILQYSEIGRQIDREGLNSYLAFGSVLGERTLFKGIRKLRPGHLLKYDGRTVHIEKYFSRKDVIVQRDEQASASALRKLLEKSVESQLMSDVPLGAFLSGGIDSSTVVGIMSKIIDRPVETFTVGFGRHDDELKYAKLVSDHFGTSHHELMVSPDDVPAVFARLVWHYDDLIWDAAAVPTYFVSELARKHVTVVLTGEGADELFAGYNRYKPFSENFWFVPFFIKKAGYDFSAHVFGRAERKSLTGEAANYSEKIQDEYFYKGKDLNSALRFDQEEILPNQLLSKVDRASMAAGLEARVPILDNTIIDFSDSIPPTLKSRGMIGKVILKMAASDLVPAEIIKRKKRGFGASALQWFNDKSMKDYALNILDDPHMTDEIKLPSLNSLLDFESAKVARNKEKKAYQMWTLLELEMWYRTFIENDGSAYLRRSV
ncbi:Glutamine--fructose-6-phosphate aminotransferase [isomerizing] [uncultured archaeon]|nr:Glutamine--fructose-6-phosphate aminotransferase [isomerizing] [uncultured archaeon]